jgi:acetyl-CoA carboxylase biotin carboxyl carrier protein
MIDLDFIERLIRIFDGSRVDSLEVERGGTRIRLSKTPPAARAAPTFVPPFVVGSAAAQGFGAPTEGALTAPPSPAGEGHGSERLVRSANELVEIKSPMVGTFYRAPAPDAPPYVAVGQRIAPGDTLCIIEAMKLMNELESEVSGTVVEVCVENAQPVEYGQVLFRVDPS